MIGSRTPGRKRRTVLAPLVTSQRDLRRTRRLVVNDPEILGGDPVFRDTRVLVHLIAELVTQASKPAE